LDPRLSHSASEPSLLADNLEHSYKLKSYLSKSLGDFESDFQSFQQKPFSLPTKSIEDFDKQFQDFNIDESELSPASLPS